MLYTILVVLLVLAIIGALPNFNLHPFGGAPSGILGTILIVLLIYVLLGPGFHR